MTMNVAGDNIEAATTTCCGKLEIEWLDFARVDVQIFVDAAAKKLVDFLCGDGSPVNPTAYCFRCRSEVRAALTYDNIEFLARN